MARRDWKVEGRLLLDPQLPDLEAFCRGVKLPLAGVRVLVEAKEFAWDPTWDDWGEDVTDAQGRFCVTKEKDGSERMFRVRVIFKDDELKIYPENKGVIAERIDQFDAPFFSLVAEGEEAAIETALEATSRLAFDVDWMTVLQDPKEEKRKPDGAGKVDFGDLVFARGGKEDLGGEYPRRHAEIWFMVKHAMAFLQDIGFPFRAGRTIALKHPHNSGVIPDALEVSYTDPVNNVVFLVRNSQEDDFNFGRILHELCHLWVFQHSVGETGLAWQLFTQGTTHEGRLKESWTGFHEAVAETISNEISRRNFGLVSTIYDGRTAENRPLSRNEMQDIGIKDASDIEFFEDGWLSALGLLLCEHVCALDMNTSDGPYARDLPSPPAHCEAPRLGLEDLLRAIALGGDGRDDGMERDDMTLVGFLGRIAASSDKLQTRHITDYPRMLDPIETKQPFEILAEPASRSDKAPPSNKHQAPLPVA